MSGMNVAGTYLKAVARSLADEGRRLLLYVEIIV